MKDLFKNKLLWSFVGGEPLQWQVVSSQRVTVQEKLQ